MFRAVRGAVLANARHMSSMTHPHAVLGVKHNATLHEVKTAYRQLAMQTHPDRNAGDDVQFKAVTEAYRRLNSGEQSWTGCGKAGTSACSMKNGCNSMWNGPSGERFVWNDRMLPELFSALLDQTGDARLQTLYERYAGNMLSRKEALLSIHNFASREQFRVALLRVAERHGREGGEQRIIYAA